MISMSLLIKQKIDLIDNTILHTGTVNSIKGKIFFDKIESKGILYDLWIPEEIIIVLGRNSSLLEDVKEAAFIDNINIIRRVGGGGTVLLDYGTLVIDIASKNIDYKSIGYFSQKCSNIIISALNSLAINSKYDIDSYDIVIKEKKVGGISIYKSNQCYLFSASLIISDTSINNIERYLKIPIKQPKYRNNRPHHDFLTSLDQFCNFSFKDFVNKLDFLLHTKLVDWL